MFFIKNKVLTVVVMLLVFVGQAMASSASPCLMDNNSQSDNPTMMNHLGHDMGASEMASDSGDLDCCDQDCACLMSSCAPVALLSLAYNGTDSVVASQKTRQFLYLVKNQYSDSLFRPPISR